MFQAEKSEQFERLNQIAALDLVETRKRQWSREPVNGIGGLDSSVERQQPRSVHDGRGAEGFDVEFLLVLTRTVDHEGTKESNGRSAIDGNLGEYRLKERGILQILMNKCRESLEQRNVAADRAHIEKNKGVFYGMQIRLGDPGLKVALPRGERLPPARVAGHVIARAGRVAAPGKRVPGVELQVRE